VRPLVIGLHGNFDRPQWFCGAMEEIVEGRAWLLCPRGRRRRDVPREYDRYTFPSRSRLRREIAAGLKALRERYPGRVAAGPALLAGFSLGAIYASRFAVAQPGRYPRLYLVEGAHRVWTPKNIRRFARGGGKAVLFGCGRRGCRAQSRRICRALNRAGVWCGEVTSPGLGHSYTAPLTRLALSLWERLVAGAAGWGK
jgi:pimeloyl-ACP methyl ester carboxylesterase